MTAGVNAYMIRMDRDALLQCIRDEINSAKERSGLGAAGQINQGVPA